MTSANKLTQQSADNWIEYRRLVLNELERLDAVVTKLATANITNERELIEAMNSYRAEIIEKQQKIKDEVIDRAHHMNIEIKAELLVQNKSEIIKLQSELKHLEISNNKLWTEVKVIRGKATILGFMAGLLVAIISLIVKIMLGV